MCLQLAYQENWREEKQSVSKAHTEDRQKETERERKEPTERETERVAVLNWDKDKTNSVDSSPLGFLTLHNIPVLPLQMLQGIKQKVYHG